MTSDVARGENHGSKLHLHFVVRQLAGPFPVRRKGNTTRTATLQIPAGANARHLGVAAFVQGPAEGETLQAVSLRDCRAQ